VDLLMNERELLHKSAAVELSEFGTSCHYPGKHKLARTTSKHTRVASGCVSFRLEIEFNVGKVSTLKHFTLDTLRGIQQYLQSSTTLKVSYNQ
jgi:hypothetical protein